jgi:hypothetical protein
MESFPIIPASSRAMWIVIAFVLLVLVGVTLMLVATTRGSTTSRFDVSSAGLRLRGDLYGRLIPLADLRSSEIRIVDLARAPELHPRRRTMGTAFPGYQAGWFRLRNGEKALLYLTQRSRAVYVPTRRGYSLLLSPQQPERFVERLRAVASGS